jgi:hypothetical protein
MLGLYKIAANAMAMKALPTKQNCKSVSLEGVEAVLRVSAYQQGLMAKNYFGGSDSRVSSHEKLDTPSIHDYDF